MNKKQHGKHGCKTIEGFDGFIVRDSIIGRDIIKNGRTGTGDGITGMGDG